MADSYHNIKTLCMQNSKKKFHHPIGWSTGNALSTIQEVLGLNFGWGTGHPDRFL
jgi:hypothetical protein